jgi:hypothetical protein
MSVWLLSDRSATTKHSVCQLTMTLLETPIRLEQLMDLDQDVTMRAFFLWLTPTSMPISELRLRPVRRV